MIEKKTKVPNAPTRYEVIDKDGNYWGTFFSVMEAARCATEAFPDQEQDEERSGKGWDVQVVGCDDPPKAWLDAKVEIDEGWL